MTLPRNPITGWPIPDRNAIMPRPGSTPNQQVPDTVAAKANPKTLPISVLNAVYRSILRQTWDAFERGESISWPKLFTYTPYWAKARIRRDIRTGNDIWKPARLSLRIRCAQSYIKHITQRGPT